MRGVRTALAAELWASHLLGAVRLAMPEPVNATELEAATQALAVEFAVLAEQAADPSALAMMRALGAVTTGSGRAAVQRVIRRLLARGVHDRAWAGAIGSPLVGRCFRQGDRAGCQESVVAGFRYGRARHALVVLIDHDLGGGVKDAWVAASLGDLERSLRVAGRRRGMFFEPIGWSRARELWSRALAQPSCPVTTAQFEDLARTRALLLARMGLAEPQPAGAHLRLVAGTP